MRPARAHAEAFDISSDPSELHDHESTVHAVVVSLDCGVWTVDVGGGTQSYYQLRSATAIERESGCS